MTDILDFSYLRATANPYPNNEVCFLDISVLLSSASEIVAVVITGVVLILLEIGIVVAVLGVVVVVAAELGRKFSSHGSWLA